LFREFERSGTPGIWRIFLSITVGPTNPQGALRENSWPENGIKCGSVPETQPGGKASTDILEEKKRLCAGFSK